MKMFARMLRLLACFLVMANTTTMISFAQQRWPTTVTFNPEKASAIPTTTTSNEIFTPDFITRPEWFESQSRHYYVGNYYQLPVESTDTPRKAGSNTATAATAATAITSPAAEAPATMTAIPAATTTTTPAAAATTTATSTPVGNSDAPFQPTLYNQCWERIYEGSFYPDGYSSVHDFMRTMDDLLLVARNIFKPRADACKTSCHPCDDEIPRCRKYDTCCPSLQNIVLNETLQSKLEGFPKQNPVCANFRVKEPGYFLIKSCPDEYRDNEKKALCEGGVAGENVTADNIAMTTDVNTKLSYYNKYCAECNQVTELTPWKVSVACATYQYVYDALDDTQLLRSSMKAGSKCSVEQYPLEPKPARCIPSMQGSPPIIASCSDTESYDPRLKTACQQYPKSVANILSFENDLYRNIFCMACNPQLLKLGCPSDPLGRPNPFEFLFGLNAIRLTPQADDWDSCRGDEWMDPEGNCRALLCADGKVLQNDTTCVTALHQIRGLRYRASVLLVANHYHEGDEGGRGCNTTTGAGIYTTTQRVADSIEDMLSPYNVYFNMDVQVIFKRPNMTLRNCESIETTDNLKPAIYLPYVVLVRLYMVSKSEFSRDVVERELLNMMIRDPLVINELIPQVNTTFHSLVIHDPSVILCDSDRFPDEVCHRVYKDTYDWTWHSPRLPQDVHIPLGGYLDCPHIRLDHDQVYNSIVKFGTTLPPSFLLAVRFGNVSIEFTSYEDLNQIHFSKDGHCLICHGILQSKLIKLKLGHQPTTVIETFKYVLTIVCMSVSLGCLTLTVMTYCLFSSLRSVTGYNTLGLSLSLILAQSLLLTASHMTQGPGVLCTLVGATNHFAWLLMFTWTFLCCLHMLRVFMSSSRSHSKSRRVQRRMVASNVLFSLFIPSSIVVTVMLTSYVTSHGERIGYGYMICSVDNVLAIYVPLVVIITTNTVFFLVVVVKIVRIRGLQSNDVNVHRSERKDFLVYIHLSSLTGVFWLLVVLGELTDNDVIRTLAILFNGSQGVFIFSAFVLNKQVVILYARRFGLVSTLLSTTSFSHANK